MDNAQPYQRLNLPQEVKFCRRCVMSNQRPQSAREFKQVKQKKVIAFDEDGICSACRYHEMKQQTIDWQAREKQLLKTLDKFRSKDGSYDVIVPGSGGKDSFYVAHVLKHKYDMHPLTVTWPPHLMTDIGRINFQAWLDIGTANVTLTPNQQFHRQLTRAAFLNLLHPFQPFILGQKQIGPKTALQHNVRLVMYGESQAEAGNNIEEAFDPVMSPKYYASETIDHEVFLGGVSEKQWLASGFGAADLSPYKPISMAQVKAHALEVHHMGYYEHWIPQEKYYYAQQYGNFQPNNERTEGSYAKYISLDDKVDGFHYFTTFIKFGVGRATYDAAQEICNQHISREEGVALVNRYDGEFPQKYFKDFLQYINIDEATFWHTIDSYRSPHLWQKTADQWQLRHRVSDEYNPDNNAA